MSLPEALERAADALPGAADSIRPSNGDPSRLLEGLEAGARSELLTWLLHHESDAAEELMAAWAEEPDGLATLESVDEADLPKAGRKQLRRLRHRLRSQGRAAPAPPPSARVSKLPPIDDDFAGAFVTGIDPSGGRLVVLVRSGRGGGASIFEVVCGEGLGVGHCEAYTATRSQARRFLREVTQRGENPAVAVDPDAARTIVARAAESQPAERALPRSFVEWKKELAEPAAGARTPGEEAREALAAGVGDSDLEAAVALVREGRIGPWPPDAQVLREVAGELGEASQSRIIVSGARQQERSAEVLEGAVERCYREPYSGYTAARCDEMAYVFWKRAAEDEARACLAAGSAFRELPPDRNPVARAMLERVLEPLLAAREEEEKSSLVVKPT